MSKRPISHREHADRQREIERLRDQVDRSMEDSRDSMTGYSDIGAKAALATQIGNLKNGLERRREDLAQCVPVDDEVLNDPANYLYEICQAGKPGGRTGWVCEESAELPCPANEPDANVAALTSQGVPGVLRVSFRFPGDDSLGAVSQEVLADDTVPGARVTYVGPLPPAPKTLAEWVERYRDRAGD